MSSVVSNEELYSACTAGDIRQAELLVVNNKSLGLNINYRDSQGRTPLYAASWEGHDTVVFILLQHGANVGIVNKNGATPLYVASQNGHNTVLSTLLKFGADPRAGQKDGYTPLHIACQKGQVACVCLLIPVSDINKQDNGGYTPLFVASQNGHGQVVTFLLQHGADSGVGNKNGVTPLFKASQKGHNAIVSTLLKLGADPMIGKKDGCTPLHIACQKSQVTCVSLLVPVSDINRQDNGGCTPLFMASQNGHDIVVALLLQYGADPGVGNTNDATPLFIASQNGHDTVVTMLLQHGADHGVRKNTGITPLVIACYNGHDKCVELLLGVGADMSVVDRSNDDAVGSAAMRGHLSCVSLLVHHGVNIRWDRAKSPLKLAQIEGHTEIVELLQKYRANPEKYKRHIKPTLLLTLTPPSPELTHCPVYAAADRFIKDFQLPDGYFDHQYDVCFCGPCHSARGDNLYYTRGDPPKDYGLPVGWCKFGLKVPARATVEGALTNWHVAFHGTRVPSVRTILKTGELLMPGDVTPEGAELNPPPGHFDPKVEGKRTPKGFDISQIYLSPSIRYSGCDVYAPMWSWTDKNTDKDHHIRVAFQVRVEPGTYKIGPQTIGATTRMDPKFPNCELEWFTKCRGVTVLVGLLVKVVGLVAETDTPTLTQVADSEPSLPQGPRSPSCASRKQGRLLYPFSYPIAPGKEMTLKEGDILEIVKEIDETHVLTRVPGPFHNLTFPMPKNYIDI